MFGFGFGEILILAAIGLIVLGPKQLPQVARVIGRTIAELKKALHDVTSQVAVSLDDEKKKEAAAQQATHVQPQPAAFPGATDPSSTKKEES